MQDLRNYGRGLMNSVPDPQGIDRIRQVGSTIRSELQRELGDSGVAKYTEALRREVEIWSTQEWPVLREHGLTNRRFIDGIIQRIAVIKTLADILGMERATEVQCRLLDMTMYDLMVPTFPSVEDYRACGNYFDAFREYSKASYVANIRDGLHEMDIIEDTPDVLAFNITYCAWHEVTKELGDPYLCYPSTCYGDEAYVPAALAGSGCQFKRKGTLATGQRVCDFRFEFNPDGDIR